MRFRFQKFLCIRRLYLFSIIKPAKTKLEGKETNSFLSRLLSEQIPTVGTMKFLYLRQDSVTERFYFHRVSCIFMSQNFSYIFCLAVPLLVKLYLAALVALVDHIGRSHLHKMNNFICWNNITKISPRPRTSAVVSHFVAKMPTSIRCWVRGSKDPKLNHYQVRCEN